jgi:hypothetical protein
MNINVKELQTLEKAMLYIEFKYHLRGIAVGFVTSLEM